jgi:hypothetical protein
MRKISTFEVVDGDWLKEYLWRYEEEEDVSNPLLACGVDSNHMQFTLGFPLYVYAYSSIVVILLLVSSPCYVKNEVYDLEGGEEVEADKIAQKSRC